VTGVERGRGGDAEEKAGIHSVGVGRFSAADGTDPGAGGEGDNAAFGDLMPEFGVVGGDEGDVLALLPGSLKFQFQLDEGHWTVVVHRRPRGCDGHRLGSGDAAVLVQERKRPLEQWVGDVLVQEHDEQRRDPVPGRAGRSSLRRCHKNPGCLHRSIQERFDLLHLLVVGGLGQFPQ
jgi:hypothetical protein